MRRRDGVCQKTSFMESANVLEQSWSGDGSSAYFLWTPKPLCSSRSLCPNTRVKICVIDLLSPSFPFEKMSFKRSEIEEEKIFTTSFSSKNVLHVIFIPSCTRKWLILVKFSPALVQMVKIPFFVNMSFIISKRRVTGRQTIRRRAWCLYYNLRLPSKCSGPTKLR